MPVAIKATHNTAEYWENAEPADPIYGEPDHPGVFIKEELLEPLGVSINQMASDLGITYRRAHEIVSGKRGITAETALLLAKYFRMSPQFWLNMQTHYELEQLRGNAELQEKMRRVRVLPRPDLEREVEEDIVDGELVERTVVRGEVERAPALAERSRRAAEAQAPKPRRKAGSTR